MTVQNKPRLIFEGAFDEYDDRDRGYRSHVLAELPDGGRYPLFFYAPVRLCQDLEEETRLGTAFIGEPGLVVIPEITRDFMEAAVSRLYEEGYFESIEHATQHTPKGSSGSIQFLVMIRRTSTGYSVDVPGLPGCVAAGISVEHARQQIAEAIVLH